MKSCNYMLNKIVHFRLDSVTGNVANLENVLEKLKNILHLKP